MARGVRLDKLQSRVLQRANLEGATLFVPPAEQIDALNESLAELYDLLRTCVGQDYYVKNVSFATTPSTDSYALSTIAPDFLSLAGIDIAMGQNIVITAKPFMFAERNRYKWFPGWIYTQPVFYRIVGGNLIFIPAPSGAFTITFWYVPTPTLLVNAGDTFDGVAGWEEYAVLDAAIKLLGKDGDVELAQLLMGRKAEMRARIEGLASQRDQGNPERVQDVTIDGSFEVGSWRPD